MIDRPRGHLADLFTRVFSDSEGPAEGESIGHLVAGLEATTAPSDLHVFTEMDGHAIIAAIVLTTLAYPEDGRDILLLSPVAVSTEHQRKGVGSRLIRESLASLLSRGTEMVMTYGDPGHYGWFGFRQVSQDEAASPMPLSQPEGWMACILSGRSALPVRGPSRCVPAFRDPAIW